MSKLKMMELCKDLYPICRSITGDGVRETLKILKTIVPELTIKEVKSGTKVFDWTVPNEWNVRDAFIEDSKGNKIIDFKENNLHVLGYSLPIDIRVTLDELKKYIYTQPDQPDAIPYVTSYYKDRVGMCMSENQLQSLKDDTYHLYINSEIKPGYLTYGEILIPGELKEEVFFSTYICHPSMANNELSGPVVAINLAKYVSSLKNRKYSYRFIFIPETIGSITYLAGNLEHLKKFVKYGFNITCVGDNKTYSFIPTRYGNTLSDKVALSVLEEVDENFKKYTYLDRGSDERQYNSPGVELPVCSICRTKYGEYEEYHTSKDNLDFISEEGLNGAYNVYCRCINVIEYNFKYRIKCLCEPQLGKRNLYPDISQKGTYNHTKDMMNFIAYADGTNDLIDIKNIINAPFDKLMQIVDLLKANELI